MNQGPFCSANVWHGVLNLCSPWACQLLKVMIQTFKIPVFSFIIYPITVSLTLFLHPFP